MAKDTIVIKKFSLEKNNGWFRETIAQKKYAWLPRIISNKRIWREYYFKVTSSFEPINLSEPGMVHNEYEFYTEKEFTLYLLREQAGIKKDPL